MQSDSNGEEFYVIGHWKTEFQIHGYAKRIYAMTQEGLWEGAHWLGGKPKNKENITKFDPENDMIAKPIEFKKYGETEPEE